MLQYARGSDPGLWWRGRNAECGNRSSGSTPGGQLPQEWTSLVSLYAYKNVESVSLSPGDWRTLSGKIRGMQGPDRFPYGGDCCGIAVELLQDETVSNLPYSAGDHVAVRFTGAGPKWALGEYAVVDMTIAEKNSDNVSSNGAAALASASYAIPLANRIRESDKRVLVLGAGGGLGSHFCQLIRQRGAEYVVGVSRSPDRLIKEPLSYDEAMDYNKEDS